ncbi:MAG: TVP38/TMEM64 family protein [Sporichthyaceae bacterium]
MLSARARLIILGVLAAVVALVLAFTGLPSSDEIRDWADDAGPSGPILFALAFAAVSLLPLPLVPLSIAAGVLFGFGVALPAVYAGGLLGAAATFGIARILGRPAVVRISGERLARIDDVVQRRGLAAIIGLRLVPIVPFTLFNYACGLSGVRTRDYLLGTAIGVIPGTCAYVAAGAYGTDPTSLPFLLAMGALAVLTVGGITMSRRSVPHHDPEPDTLAPATEPPG